MTRYPYALAASLIEDGNKREAFIRRAARNATNPYAIIRDHSSREHPSWARPNE